MSDEPKTIYAEQTGYFMRDGIYHNGGRWNDDEKSGLVEYRRADLPPTLAAAMELPEIKALVEAIEDAIAASPTELNLGNYSHDDVCKLQDEAIDVWQILTAALAAIKEKKDMTNPAILEALARAIHCHDGRLPTPWDADMIARWPDDCEYERKVAMSQAAAVLELVGPRKLEWTKHPKARIWRCTRGGYTYKVFGVGHKPTWDFDSLKGDYKSSVVEDTDKGFAAAQAHADAAYWAQSKIGGE